MSGGGDAGAGKGEAEGGGKGKADGGGNGEADGGGRGDGGSGDGIGDGRSGDGGSWDGGCGGGDGTDGCKSGDCCGRDGRGDDDWADCGEVAAADDISWMRDGREGTCTSGSALVLLNVPTGSAFKWTSSWLQLVMISMMPDVARITPIEKGVLTVEVRSALKEGVPPAARLGTAAGCMLASSSSPTCSACCAPPWICLTIPS